VEDAPAAPTFQLTAEPISRLARERYGHATDHEQPAGAGGGPVLRGQRVRTGPAADLRGVYDAAFAGIAERLADHRTVVTYDR
jgi:hypothetical protein